MVKRLATSPHDPLGITDSACKNHLVVVSVQYGPFNPYIPIRSTTIGKSRVAIDPIAMHTSWRSNSDIASATSVQVLGTKKTISSSYICPADGSHYKQSAVGLVFMEWAAGLAMETSKVESAVLAIQEEEESQAGAGAMKKSAGALSVDDISSDVIIQQERYSGIESADEVTQEDKSIIVEEDPGEAIDEPDASNSSIQSRAYMNQLFLRIQSLGNPVASYIIQSHTVAAVVHLRSLGVLTAAGCGIGSVHTVVRSNLLVEPSEVEEGEM
ncbi:polyneuridine-aldehyde esterase-like [Dorcoceras hygrometricum]|uniref:Polyneuridine-aldehyde esterase-like n=1 Tax=Dorcoceras hygrometricum TaxID=472368 RepID=A0A2Z7D706_9LAMI|nr:polyneuridine-aldehyde esterase-like [Dorcoceras hygrometricum]